MFPLNITFRSVSSSPVINSYINKRYEKISHLCHKIHLCKVVIDVDQKHGLKGKVFSVHIDLAIPGKRLVSKKTGFNLFIATRDAFDTLEKNILKHRKRKLVQIQHYHQSYMRQNDGSDGPTLPEAS